MSMFLKKTVSAKAWLFWLIEFREQLIQVVVGGLETPVMMAKGTDEEVLKEKKCILFYRNLIYLRVF